MQIKDMVAKILRDQPRTRNNDTELYFAVIDFFFNCGITKAQIETMKQLPFESITRYRRELQHDNDDLKADKSVQDYRETKCEESRQHYGLVGRARLEEAQRKIQARIMQEQTQNRDLPF